jgi:urease accessory protein
MTTITIIKISRGARFLPAAFFLPTLVQAHHAEFMSDRPFLQGLTMPVHGLDHLLVALAVGMIAAQIGGRARWTVPAVFCVSILLGGIANILGFATPLVEWAILGSIAICGALLAWGSRVSLLATSGAVALFAFFHGEALITNDGLVHSLPQFIAGCLTSTLLLLSAGVGSGILWSRLPKLPVYRSAGIAMLAAAVVLSTFPDVNDCLVRLIER